MLSKKEIHRIRMGMIKENMKHPATMAMLPAEDWPGNYIPPGIKEVWRSNKFLAQVHEEKNGSSRVSICRTMMGQDGKWEENITWEEIMQVKREIGQGESYSVEVYPEDSHVINVANFRHIWILPEPLVGWRK